jgi:hypothetical protein
VVGGGGEGGFSGPKDKPDTEGQLYPTILIQVRVYMEYNFEKAYQALQFYRMYILAMALLFNLCNGVLTYVRKLLKNYAMYGE